MFKETHILKNYTKTPTNKNCNKHVQDKKTMEHKNAKNIQLTQPVACNTIKYKNFVLNSRQKMTPTVYDGNTIVMKSLL